MLGLDSACPLVVDVPVVLIRPVVEPPVVLGGVRERVREHLVRVRVRVRVRGRVRARVWASWWLDSSSEGGIT